MTEREKRIVVIRRISEVLSASWCRKGKCTENECAIDECDLLTTAKVLHDAGYRKEEEVQKETAQKIWDELFAGSILMMLARCDYNAEYNEMADEIRRVFKKFGTKIAKIDQ